MYTAYINLQLNIAFYVSEELMNSQAEIVFLVYSHVCLDYSEIVFLAFLGGGVCVFCFIYGLKNRLTCLPLYKQARLTLVQETVQQAHQPRLTKRTFELTLTSAGVGRL